MSEVVDIIDVGDAAEFAARNGGTVEEFAAGPYSAGGYRRVVAADGTRYLLRGTRVVGILRPEEWGYALRHPSLGWFVHPFGLDGFTTEHPPGGWETSLTPDGLRREVRSGRGDGAPSRREADEVNPYLAECETVRVRVGWSPLGFPTRQLAPSADMREFEWAA